MSATGAINPDQALLHGFVPGSLPVAIDTVALGRTLGATIVHVDRDAGRVQLSFRPGPELLQGGEAIGGGAVAAMLDYAAGLAVLAALPAGLSVAGADLSVAFLRPVRAAACSVTGWVERCGSTVAFASAALHVDGERAATGRSTLVVRRPRD